MKTQRITISMPDYIYSRLIKVAPARGVSEFVTKAIQAQFLVSKEKKKEDPIEKFIALRKTLPKFSRKEILAAIHKGRE